MILRSSLLAMLLLFFFPAIAQRGFRLLHRGKVEKAERISRKILSDQKQSVAGRDFAVDPYRARELHPISKSYHALAMIYTLRGDYTNALIYLDKADSVHAQLERIIAKRKTNKHGGPKLWAIGADIVETRAQRPLFARQIEKARIDMRLGDMQKAKKRLDQTHWAMNREYGAETSKARAVFSAYGEYFKLSGQYDSSAVYYEKYIIALFSDPKFFDKSIKEISDAYAGLAETYQQMDKLPMAVAASKKSVRYARHRFVRETDGKNPLGKIEAANQLAESYRLQADYKKALNWNDAALGRYEKRIRVVSPEKLPILATRGQIFWALADTANANKCFREMMQVFFQYTQQNFSYLSEGERAYFFRTNKHFVDLAKGYYQHLYFQRGFKQEYIARNLYEINLNNKGVLLSSSSKLLNELNAKGDKALNQEYVDIRTLRDRKTRLIEVGKDADAQALENDIAQKEKHLRSVLAIDAENYVTQPEVIRSIPAATTLVDVMKCPVYNMRATSHQSDSVPATGDSRYLYFVFDQGKVHLTQSEQSSKELEGRLYKAYLNYARADITNTEGYTTYFKPIEQFISNRNVILSGDGIYNLLNPDILFNGTEFLINRYSFLSIVSVKDLLKLTATSPNVTDITLIGWPDYATHLKRYPIKPADLPGTETEINGIRKTIPVSVQQHAYTQGSANEIIVKDIPSTSILHFATHGFFEASESKDPMYTSGLVLALSEGATTDEDGYLTAYEASNLDLKKTFLVVLSACQTGQGEAEDGEGVWGLQRAFQVAGVRYIVMSLFKVDDEVTATLMQQFYSNMVQGDPVLVAFRKAQLLVKAKYPKPVEWGAFVVKGF